jgi:hypothetical protein
MKIRNLLVGFFLAMMVLFVGTNSTASPAAPSCASVCINNYSACQNFCAGDPACLNQCQIDFDCCRIMCHGHECLTKSP